MFLDKDEKPNVFSNKEISFEKNNGSFVFDNAGAVDDIKPVNHKIQVQTTKETAEKGEEKPKIQLLVEDNTYLETQNAGGEKPPVNKKIFHDSNNINAGRFINNQGRFIDETKRAFETEWIYEGSANISGIDLIVENALESYKDKTLEKHDKYKELWVETKQKEKQLKKELKAEEKEHRASTERFEQKQEKFEQLELEKKAIKKADNKEIRKAATVTVVAKFFNAKKNLQNQLGAMSGESSGDLIKDGSGGLLSTFRQFASEIGAGAVKAVTSTIWKYLAAMLGTVTLSMAMFMLMVVLLLGATSAIVSGLAADSDAGESYSLDVNGDGRVYTSLSDEQITGIINTVKSTYGGLSWQQEKVIYYALSKVGCEYNQLYHWSMTIDIFDCSSLAYRAYNAAHIDISNEGLYTAADECYRMVVTNKVPEGDLQPGDLIFYGGSDNGRYLGVYHVGIYIGNIGGVDKMVEARGESWGVVYGDVRSKNVVKVARPYQ